MRSEVLPHKREFVPKDGRDGCCGAAIDQLECRGAQNVPPHELNADDRQETARVANAELFSATTVMQCPAGELLWRALLYCMVSLSKAQQVPNAVEGGLF